MILAVSLPTPGARVSESSGAFRIASADPSSCSNLRTLTGPILGSMLSAMVASRLFILLLLVIMNGSASSPLFYGLFSRLNFHYCLANGV